ncbi:zinc finger CCCH-type containing 7Ba isoform X1 [Electrophorus electricus]|uniref:zinc finger CCCH-type containing 7Ba isoform X1 n=1 Tax=Electrophorus electricus TaxID=8005 RepID=UPI0015CF8A9C|nr:zinc finger CCCH-type containing 7Ba isoform X1 [Electrophorus electricus]XP_026877846.2 zinc finger CCCH-type containing 7Ba isoform X1 [Electrophorus electricus]
MSLERHKRKEDIQRALAFIQSSLPYPDPEGYEGFLMQLVCNLLDEGNAAFREGDWILARGHFSEGISVARYGQDEDVAVPPALLESLYVNRAAAQHYMREFESAVRDCDSALGVRKDSGRALYRKALCLKELGQLKEAYECITACLIVSPQDEKVSEMAQELASKLELKTRKAYIGLQDRQTADAASEDGLPSLEQISNGLDSLCDVAVALPDCVSPVLPAPVPVSDACEDHRVSGAVPESAASGPQDVSLSVPVSEPLVDCELVGEELDSLLDCVSKQEELLQTPSKGSVVPTHVPAAGVIGLGPSFPPLLPAPSPRLPPAFFPSAVSQLNTLDSFTGPDLDPSLSGRPLDVLDSFVPSEALLEGGTPQQPPLVVGEGLDSLSEFTLPGGKISNSFLPAVKIRNYSDCLNSANGQVASALFQLSRNPLEHTHDFTQACTTCFTRIGPGVLDCEYRAELAHSCKKDILLCRRKGGDSPPWRRVRPRPTRSNFLGAYVLCKEVLERQDCKYGEACTFAYCQEEIDVWTQERRGLLTRELLFNPLSTNQRQALSVIKLLNMHNGMFMFLCEMCFDTKPRIISKRCKENPSLCSNMVTQHPFERNKCLVHMVKSSSIYCSKIRPLRPLCLFDVCRHELRYGCQRESSCSFAHSLIELQCWILEKDHGISHEEIVQESKKHWHKQRPGNMPMSQTNGTAAKGEGSGKGAEPNRKAVPVQTSGSATAGAASVSGQAIHLLMKFVCGQCWRDGLVSEADKALKYCSAKARHSWTKDRRVLLVRSPEREKWVAVRPLPFAKTYPQQYDICVHVLKQKKCHYIGNCTFAHNPEEKELWTYMKNTGLRDLQHVYDVWVTTANHNKRLDGSPLPQPVEEKQIAMPTDFAEPMDGFHCRLCGKHSNSERQWQQHISSERHKDRVLSGAGEDESLTWTQRFPGRCFALCPRLPDSCTEGLSCDFAHSEVELQEWRERRDFLRRRLDKARADMLIASTDYDFGKYNFLLHD